MHIMCAVRDDGGYRTWSIQGKMNGFSAVSKNYLATKT